MTLQLFALELDSQNALVRFSSFLSLIALGIYLFTIYIITRKCGSHKFSIEEYSYKLKFMSLFEGIKNDNYTKYFQAISLIKKLLFMLILIFCYQQPYFQVFNLVLLSILEIIWLILFKPLEDLNEFLKQISCEINKSITLFFISALVLDQEVKIFSENSRSIIGWICIGSISLILAIQLIIDAIFSNGYSQSKNTNNSEDLQRNSKDFCVLKNRMRIIQYLYQISDISFIFVCQLKCVIILILLFQIKVLPYEYLSLKFLNNR
ncbi:unnamed protein product [Paramecium sonneborni]|uniref:Transmembrane protein n=1 Tax=Paramecium sonneborni TaxID=65129 RepID=A0A8S1RMP1_9CILI|nr:unnamed protein product [Paramecium sonneborni]